MSKWKIVKTKPEEERWILSIDGGGMRGIVPAVLLAHLSQLLIEKNDLRPLYSHFDLIAGTSTGAILAAAMTAPITDNTLLKRSSRPDFQVFETERKGFRKVKVFKGNIEQLADPEDFLSYYMNNGSSIFSPKGKLFGSLFSEKYNEHSLEFFFHRLFQSGTMDELKLPTVLVSYNPVEGEAKLFRSYEDKDLPIRDAVRASSAAPMYFSPANISGKTLLDGGVIANNPSLVAYSEARKLYPNCTKFHLLSLSTMSPRFKLDANDVGGGLTGWIEPITKLLNYTQLKNVDTVAASIPDLDYIRIWKDIEGEKIHLDDVRPEALSKLKDLADELIKEKEAVLDRVTSQLAAAKTTSSIKLEVKLLTDSAHQG